MGRSKPKPQTKGALLLGRLYGVSARRAYSVIIFAALFCTLAVKLFHSARSGLGRQYPGWILADISFLLMMEIILALICFRWPRPWVLRAVIVVAALACAWSVMNAGWLIRNGMQILPATILPLFRDPLNAFRIIGDNLIKMPAVAAILLAPSAAALAFFFSALAKPQPPNYNRKRFFNKTLVSLIIVIIAVLARWGADTHGSPSKVSQEMRYNCQLRALMGPFLPKSGRVTRADLANAKRRVPTIDQLELKLLRKPRPFNVVVLILEGVQYNYTSLADSQSSLTPYLAELAAQGAEFANARTSLSHTTKALFGLLTGRFPSASYDIVEAVPVSKPYAAMAGILKRQQGFRTAFFQSAKGNFESRPGLVHNLGFDKFWARDNLNDPNAFLGSLSSDEFSMLKPITEWILADERPFFLTVLCSVTHDSYEVPGWFAEPAKELVDRYRQAVPYTDQFIAALDAELARLNLVDKTILCVIGDHGEAFGEHGLHGHERIAFDEVLRVPWVIRAPSTVEPGTKVKKPVSSIDMTPTLLALLGFDIESADFDGLDALSVIPEGRKVYFSDWKHAGPAGFVQGHRKVVYNPESRKVFLYDLSNDPGEFAGMQVSENQGREIADAIIGWRKRTIFQLDRDQPYNKMLFGCWTCRRRSSRDCSAKYCPPAVY
ncbi:MAG: LTA synthase family protein [Planctomycetota bacterium]